MPFEMVGWFVSRVGAGRQAKVIIRITRNLCSLFGFAESTTCDYIGEKMGWFSRAPKKTDDEVAAERIAALPPFNPTATCPKCGHDQVAVRFVAGGCQNFFGPPMRVLENMMRTCGKCSYVWHERAPKEINEG